ncbi:short-chain fatty acyl-CoA regulator family protein [Novosphingobium colocasiae]|uniref:helix-turn-helix domain-containing protein n=1 Tax=Novosphingobium colocasiae TaxID=1256513 RepID=UPI0035AE0C73
MAQNRPLYLGPRLRRLRRELGLTQQVMAADLEISPSYIALLERNQRPVTADMLLRLATSYRLDISDLALDTGEDYARRVSDVLRDPIFADIDLPALEVADLAMSFPGVSEALLRLYTAYTREQQALAEREEAGSTGEVDPTVEAQRYMAAASMHFPELEARAEELAAEIDTAGGAEKWLAAKGVRVRFLPPDVLVNSLRRFDRHNQQLLLDETLDGPARAFQLATHIAYTAMRPDLARLLRDHRFTSPTAQVLARRALAGYAATALLMPYSRFVRAVDARGYDIEAIARHFGSTFEQVAHRLVMCNRPGDDRVPFFLIRMDEAGNVSKRLDATGVPFAMLGGPCPLWQVHTVFRRPGEIATQWLELPDGQRFFSIARTVTAYDGRFGRAPLVRAIALVCAAQDAPRTVYAAGLTPDKAPVTPIGLSCRLCHRAECRARAVPPIGREILADDTNRPTQPFSFSES